MTYDASNRKSIRAAEKQARIDERTALEFLAHAMSTVPGRLWLHDLLASCQIFAVAPAFESARDYFALGQRNVGSRIFADILTHCPDQYILMMKEANVRLATATERTRLANDGRDAFGFPGRPGEPESDPDTLDLFDPYIAVADE